MKLSTLVAIVTLAAGSSFAFDKSQNPDRFLSFGVDLSTGKLPGMLTANQPGAPATDGGFVKGALDVRVPITNAVTIHTFGSTTGVNNNLQFSSGNELGVGFRVYLQ